MVPLGFSTGCMYKSSLMLENIISFYSHIGADALEISFGEAGELRTFHLDEGLLATINSFSYVSIHAPLKGIKYGDNDFSRLAIRKLGGLCDKLPVQGIVVHPETVDDFKVLEESGLPFLIENMDKRKTRGILAAEFTAYSMLYKFGFVLDLKHVYEHDPTMALAADFVNAMGDRLKELHVSGHDSSSNHAMLHTAQNREAIAEAIGLCTDVPIIIESVFDVPNAVTARRELDYIRQYLH